MSIHSKFRKFLTCTRASSAIEFAMVAPLFLLVVFAIFEVGFIFLTDLALESALSNASRYIRTGQSIKSGTDADKFRQVICDNAYGMIDCNNLNVVVGTFSSFEDGSTQMPKLFDNSGKLENSSLFDIGGSDSIVVVRTTYIYDVLNGFGEMIKLSNYGDNKYLHVHIVAFKNEPFG
uniref:TadE-like domain-containing protein n=1 Tax=OCS116 cluster bacterium TaxID=2030921 RepID=A0A2A4YQ43_9PROT